MLAWLGGVLFAPHAVAQPTTGKSRVVPFAEVVPGYVMRFPYDEGSHPAFRLEWWYVTGLLDSNTPQPLGFQVTFFRVRPARETDNPSAFTPRQLLIAHAALSDPREGRLISLQRAARAGFELADAAEGRTAVWIDEWALEAQPSGYRIRIPGRDFALDLALAGTQAPLLNGDSGFSRKGPARASASYYYSIPQLAVSGRVVRHGEMHPVRGTAWLDHEWSSSYLDEHASGWDWIGINLDDGAALMAFRIRDRQQNRFWAGATYRDAGGTTRAFAPEAVQFTATRHWQSPRTGTRYPVAWTVSVRDMTLAIEPTMDDQEHDTSASTGAVYWEGAVRALRAGKRVGAGYLELTGYGKPLKL